jgi:hypothetical protein
VAHLSLGKEIEVLGSETVDYILEILCDDVNPVMLPYVRKNRAETRF